MAGTRANSAEEVIARLVDYGPVSLSLVVWATMIAVVPYPTALRWAFPILVGLYMIAYQYLVARDTRPPRLFASVSLRWFVLGSVAGIAGFFASLEAMEMFEVPLVERMGPLGLVPFQASIGLILFQSAQGFRGRHSIFVSMIGILTTGLAVMACQLFVLTTFEITQFGSVWAALPNILSNWW